MFRQSMLTNTNACAHEPNSTVGTSKCSVKPWGCATMPCSTTFSPCPGHSLALQPEALQDRAKLLFGDVIHGHRCADFYREHEVQPAVDDLLVAADCIENVVGRQIRDRRQWTKLRDELSQRLPFALGKCAASHAQISRSQHAEGNRF